MEANQLISNNRLRIGFSSWSSDLSENFNAFFLLAFFSQMIKSNALNYTKFQLISSEFFHVHHFILLTEYYVQYSTFQI